MVNFTYNPKNMIVDTNQCSFNLSDDTVGLEQYCMLGELIKKRKSLLVIGSQLHWIENGVTKERL